MLCVGCSILSFSNCCCLFCASFRYLVGAGVGNKLLNLKQWFSTFSPGIPAPECFGKRSYRKAMCEHVSTQSVQEQFLKGPAPLLVACRPFDKVGNLMLGKKDSSKSSPHWRIAVQVFIAVRGVSAVDMDVPFWVNNLTRAQIMKAPKPLHSPQGTQLPSCDCKGSIFSFVLSLTSNSR